MRIATETLAREIAMTVALAGCGDKRCLAGRPPKLCAGCAQAVVCLRVLMTSRGGSQP